MTSESDETSRESFAGTRARRETSPSWLAPPETLRPQMDAVRRFAHDVGRMFEDWGLAPNTAFHFGQWPPIEVLDRDGRLVVRAELPSVRKEDVRVRVEGNTLVIEGERRKESERENEGVYQSEWSYGRFVRRVPLPGNVKAERVTARFQDGVLEVTASVEAPAGREVPIEGRGTSPPRSARP